METKSRPCFSLHLLIPLFLSSLNTNISTATDTISKGHSLSGNQTLVSKGGNFELGFFTPATNSHNYYIGIWYKKLPTQTIIWVANRESPISNPSSSKLSISEFGNLVLLIPPSNNPIWSSHSTPSKLAQSTSAVLLDTGNLILINGSDSESYLWQSFDHPTDTIIPGVRIGLNKITGEQQSLTSWKNKHDPAPGLFSLSLDPDGSDHFVLIWNWSEIYWRSGLLTSQFSSLAPGTEEDHVFDLSFSDSKYGKFITYTLKDNSAAISRWVVGPSLAYWIWTWQSRTQQWETFHGESIDRCSVYSICGPFGLCDQRSSSTCWCLDGFRPTNVKEWELDDWSSGCERKTKLQCGDGDGFVEVPNVSLPANGGNLKVGSENECRMACLSNCSCNAYAYDGSECAVWNGELRNLRRLYDGEDGGGTLFLRLSASDIIPSSSSSHKKVIAATVSAVLVMIFCMLFVLIWACRRRRKIQVERQGEGSLIRFSYSELQRMTKNFSAELGSGGFGSVFKGIMPDSTSIAVKKLEGVRQGEKQFRTEVSTLGVIQHVNLVRLRGFCFEGISKRLLVYDYTSRGSLDSHLFRDGPIAVNWKMRYQIILGVARGLAYLHEKCRDCIIHCDVKPDNILLDDNFCPKVSDFGMAKLVGQDFSRVLTTVRGTVGYLAPEWISGLPITSKVDVYSFGMMLFEIVSGKRNTGCSADASRSFYPTWAARNVIFEEGQVMSLVDERLENFAAAEEVTRVLKVAIWCIQDREQDRPSMGQVLQIMEGVLEVKMPPFPVNLQNLCTNSGSSLLCDLDSEEVRVELHANIG